MEDWIPFAEGEYHVERALLLGKDFRAVEIIEPFIEIYKDKKGIKHLKGIGQVEPLRVVELLEDTDHPDLFLDLGAGYRFLMKKPNFKAGKVFAPSEVSAIHFYPELPWQTVSESEYAEIQAKVTFVEPSGEVTTD
jgi:hypothetical protein